MVYVFKTTLEDEKSVEKIRLALDHSLPGARWNFDLEDCDHILKVESREDVVARVVQLLNAYNFDCEELE